MLMSTIYTYQENKRGYWEYDVKIIEKMYEDAYEIIERKMKPIRVPELEEFEVAIDIFDKKYILKGDDGRIMISEDDDGDLYVSVMWNKPKHSLPCSRTRANIMRLCLLWQECFTESSTERICN